MTIEQKTTKHNATLVRFLLKKHHVRGVLVIGQDLIERANHIHGLQGAPAEVFGHVLLSSMLLLSISKGGVRQVLQLDAMHEDAPITRIQAETRPGCVRGYLSWNQHAQIKSEDDNYLLSAWMRKPIHTSTVRDLGYGTPYVSTIEHDSDYIADHILQYLHQSTQVRADIALSDKQGLMLEAMPECTEDDWFNAITVMARIDNDALAQASAETILQAFANDGCHILGEDKYAYQCNCNPESIFQSLQAFSNEQLMELANERGEISLSCQYCKKHYLKQLA